MILIAEPRPFVKSLTFDKKATDCLVRTFKSIPKHDGLGLLSVSLPELAGWRDDSDPLQKCPCR
jgi:hypothetical protein